MPKSKTKEREYLNFLFSSHKMGTVLGLKRIQFLLNKLGNPQNSFKSIHIAGTNGKGSTAAVLTQILMEYGFKTGLYTSPHIKRFSERIQINSIEISDKDLITEIKTIKKIIDKEKAINPLFEMPTFFELGVAITYNYFKRKKVDFAVIETGLGGRLDATNILSPEISIITNISIEHTEYLGKTIPKIAFEKAGIIKSNSIAITSEKNPKALKVIKTKAKKEKVLLLETKKSCKTKNYSFSLDKQKFDLEIEKTKINGIESNLKGEFQLDNISTAILAFKKLNLGFNKIKIKNAVKKAFIPGRFQVCCKKPLIIFDAGHNPAGFKEIKKTILLMKQKKLFEKFNLLIGVSSDKDIKEISRIIFPSADKIIISSAKYRGMPIEKLAEYADKHKKPFIGFHETQEAFEFALSETGKKDLLLVIGSVFFLGELKVNLF